MNLLFRVLTAALASLLCTAAPHAQSVYDLPSEGPSLDEIGVPAALNLVLSFDLPSPTAEQALLAAARVGNTTLIPLLKQIVTAYAEPGSVGFLALHALWELGETPNYFFGLAAAPATPDGVVFNALWVAARNPTPSGLALAQDAASGRGGRVADAVREYADLLTWKGEVAALPISQQVPTLLDDIAQAFTVVLSTENGVTVAPGRPDGDLQPGAVWARTSLRSLAATDSDSVAFYLANQATPPQILAQFGDNAGQINTWFEEYVSAIAFPTGEIPTAPLCAGLPATVYVSPAGRVVGGPLDGALYAGLLTGTDGPDVIAGTQAPDVLDGRGGDDTLCGGPGDDALDGGGGQDTADGGSGADGCDASETATACDGPIPVLTQVLPVAQCVVSRPDGGYTAYFGYDNRSGRVGRIPHTFGRRSVRQNVIWLLSADGQGGAYLAEKSPDLFALPGRIVGQPGQTPPYPEAAFSVSVGPPTSPEPICTEAGPDDEVSCVVPVTIDDVAWTLLDRTVTATRSGFPECPAP